MLAALTTREDVVRYYQAALDKHRRGLLAAVTWDLLRKDGTVLVHWRQSYNLSCFGNDEPKAFASTSHVA